ncbi:MAG: putative DNA binding domain-containing protein [Planctomycetes bacterium]|nr:putative DNA binding domain-containing protein [Planctomycetota bacterium]
MKTSKIKEFIRQGEGISVEFKECKNSLSKDVFETVCSFLNRLGGILLLGVNNHGRITGIDRNCIEQIKKDFATTVNNPQKITPAFYLTIEEIQISGRTILYIYIPESSQVHRCNGRIYDRNEDGDFDITDNSYLVTELYVQKQTTYSENKVYPFVKITDLRKDLIARARKLAGNQKPNHPWLEMNDRELLKSAQLYLKDYQSGKQGFTLAGVLLLGKDNVILSILPHFRTDAILRRENLDRYDDRDDIRTNLIESYDRLMAFTAKHLPDKFYLEKDHRINLRDHIFREVAGNILIHREYLNPFPAKFIIEKNRVYTENSNKPHGHGLIDPANFSPFPKNPVIARFFKEIGRADELGSGVKNLFKYGMDYAGAEPQLIEGDIFKTIIPLSVRTTPQVSDQAILQATQQVTPQVTQQVEGDKISRVLAFCVKPKTRGEIQELLGLRDREHFRSEILNPLIKKGLLALTIPDKPNSPKQKYYSVAASL